VFYKLGFGKAWHYLYHAKVSFLFFSKDDNNNDDLINYFEKDDLIELNKNYRAIKQKYKKFM